MPTPSAARRPLGASGGAAPCSRRPTRLRRLGAFAACAVAATSLAACGSSPSAASSGSSADTGSAPTGSLTIALQEDIAFAPLYIIEQEDWLHQVLPKVSVSWDVLSSGSAIQSGMLSGSINVGAVGIAPFVIGESEGVKWKLLDSLGDADQYLVVKPSITSFKDIKSKDRIAVVSPTSVEAIALQKMAQSKLGKASALNADFVTMTQPEAEESFVAGSIQGVVAVDPYAQQEIAAGGHVLDTSYDEFGRSTLDSVVIDDSYYTAHTAVAKALSTEIQRAIALLSDDPKQAAKILFTYFKGDEKQSTLLSDITSSDQTWTVEPSGYLAYGKFIESEGLIKSAPTAMGPVEEPTLAATPGN